MQPAAHGSTATVNHQTVAASHSRTCSRIPDHPGIYVRRRAFVVIWRDKAKRQHSRSFTDLDAAVEFQASVAPPTVRSPSQTPFNRYALAWIDEYTGRTSRGLTASTRESYRDSMTRFAIPHFYKTPLAEITPRDFKAYVRHLSDLGRLAPSTIRRIVAPTKALFKEAYEDGLITVDIGRIRVVIPHNPTAMRPKTITADQVRGILDNLSPSDAMLYCLLAATGLRINEALSARWQDIQATDDGPVIVIGRGKTESSEAPVALGPHIIELLTAYRPHNAEPTALLFPTRHGTRQDDHNVRTRLRRVTKPLGITASPHTFRHSLLTALVDAGYPISQVQRIARHSKPTTTLAYYVHPNGTPRFDDRLLLPEASEQQIARTT